MGLFDTIFKSKKSSVDWEKAFAKTPAQVFAGDSAGIPEAPPLYAQNDLQEMAKRKDLNPLFYQRCGVLAQYDIVMLLDDSGSMNSPTDTKNAQGDKNTRWTELQEFASDVVSVGVAMDADGIDVHFLNRPSLLNVKSARTLEETFRKLPKGLTPLPERLSQILQEYRARPKHKNLLLLIATDGEPSGADGKRALKRLLEKRDFDREKVSILACSDDDSEIGYLNEFDRDIQALDVVDDYKSEKREIRKMQGSSYPFSRIDHIFKCLLGSIDKWTDLLDERKLSAAQLKYAVYGDI